MSELDILIDGGYENYYFGSKISGKASWNLQTQPKAVVLLLYWTTTNGYKSDWAVAATQHFENPTLQDQKPFSFDLPHAPFSYEGNLFSIKWGLKLVVEPGGIIATKNITISSTGYTIQIP